MNNWTDITDIFSWFPVTINNFAQTYGYEYDGANYTKHKYLMFDGPETYIEVHTAKNASHLGYVIITKELPLNNPIVTKAYINVELDLPFSLTPDQFFAFVNEQVTHLLESL